MVNRDPPRDPPTSPRGGDGGPPSEQPHQDISSTLPPTLRTKGSALLRNLTPTLQWNDRGEILSDGKPIPGSNITDLVHTAVRVSRKPKRWPEGWEYFRRHMKETNVPQILLGSGPQFDEHDEDVEDEDEDVKMETSWTGAWDKV